MKNTTKPAVLKVLDFLIRHSIPLCIAVACALAVGSVKAATDVLLEGDISKRTCKRQLVDCP